MMKRVMITEKIEIKYGLDCLLINPPDDFSRYPYLGLCYIAGSLRNRGMTVEILDSVALGFKTGDVVNHILNKRPRIIGITVMSMTLPYCYSLIRHIQEKYPMSVIVVGGAHINADPNIIVDMNIRYGFRGECELVFPTFCESILKGEEPVRSIPGLIVNNNGVVCLNDPAFIEDLNTLPPPAYDLLPLNKYYSPSSSLKTISSITSRGCPYNCIFCSKLQQTKYRYLNTEKVLDQIDILINQMGIKRIEFVDEIFTLNKERVIELCHGIINRGYKFQWGCGTRADRIDEELLKIMKEAGCSKIGFGIESGVERVRFIDHKKITNEQINETIRLCQKYRIKSFGDYIFGHPTETLHEMKETLKYSLKLKTDIAYYAKMIPIPDSELFKIYTRSGVINSDIWKSYMLGKRPYPIYYPDTISKKSMDKIYKYAWIRFYLSPRRILQSINLLLNPRFLVKSVLAFYALATGKKYKK